MGKLSPLQGDESRYYATVVLSKTNDRVKLTTVEWRKELLESWLARVGSQVPSGSVLLSADYTLPTISGGGCIDDTWIPISALLMSEAVTRQFGGAVK